MGTDIIGVQEEDGELLFLRPVNAGSVVATVALLGEPKVLTVRASAFKAAEPGEGPRGRRNPGQRGGTAASYRGDSPRLAHIVATGRDRGARRWFPAAAA